MTTLQTDELRKTLEIMFDAMQKHGILPPGLTNKKAIIDEVVNQLSHVEIQKESLKDPKVQKALCLSIVSEVVAAKEIEMAPGKKPQLKLDYAKLFEEKNSETLKKELTGELTQVLTALHTLTPQGPTPNITKEAEQIAEKLAKDFKYETNDGFAKQVEIENKNTLDVFEELQGACLYSLFGYSPNGRIPTITTGIIANLNGYANNEPPTENSFMGRANKEKTEDLGLPGDKSTTIIDDLMKGMSDLLEKEGILKPENEHKYKTPFDITRGPRPKDS